MADEGSGRFPFTTDIGQVEQEIRAAVGGMNEAFASLHGLPTDVATDLANKLERDIGKSIGDLQRLQTAIAETGKLPVGVSSQADGYKKTLEGIRQTAATTFGEVSQRTGVDLKLAAKQFDAAITSTLLPVLKNSVNEVRNAVNFGSKVSGSISSFSAVNRQDDKAFTGNRQLDQAYNRGVKSARDEGFFQRAQPSEPNSRQQTTAKPAEPIVAATTAASDSSQYVKLTRLSEAQTKALSHLTDTFKDIRVDFPTKTTAQIPRADIATLQEHLRSQAALTSDRIPGVGESHVGGTSEEVVAAKRRLSTLNSLDNKIEAAGAAYQADTTAHQHSATVTEQGAQAAAKELAAPALPPPPKGPPPPAPAAAPAPEPEPPRKFVQLTQETLPPLPPPVPKTGHPSSEAGLEGEEIAALRAANLARVLPPDLRGLINPKFEEVAKGFYQSIEALPDGIKESLRNATGGLKGISNSAQDLRELEQARSRTKPGDLERRAQTVADRARDRAAADLENQRFAEGLPRSAPDGSRLLAQAFEENNARNLKAQDSRLRGQQEQAARLENERFAQGLPRLAPDGSRLLEQAFNQNNARILKSSENRYRALQEAAARLENDRFKLGLPRLAPDGSGLLEQAFKQNDARNLKSTENRYRAQQEAAARLENDRFKLGLPRLAPDGTGLLEKAFEQNDARNLKSTENRYRATQEAAARLENDRFKLGLPRLAPDGSALLKQAFDINDARNLKSTENRYRAVQETAARLENDRFKLGLPRLAPDGTRLLEKAFEQNDARNLKSTENRYRAQQETAARLENDRFKLGLPRLAPDGTGLLAKAFEINDARNLKSTENRYRAQQETAARLENDRFKLGLPRLAPDGTGLLAKAFEINDARNLKSTENRYRAQQEAAARLENDRFKLGLPRLAPDGTGLLAKAFEINDARNLKSTENRYRAQQETAARLENDRFKLGLPRLAPDGTGLLAKAFELNDARNLKSSENRYRATQEAAARLENDRFKLGLPRLAPDGTGLLEQAFQQNKERNVNADNAKRLRGKATDGSYDNATVVGPRLVQDALGNLYREVATGLKQLNPEEQLQTLGRINAANARRAAAAANAKGDPQTIPSAFFQGLTSSNYGVNQGKGGGGFDPLGLAKSAGVTLKYAALGSILYGAAGAAQAAGKQFLDFADSVTEANIALEGTGAQASQQFFNELSSSAVNAGANVGQSLDVASSAMRAFKDEAKGGAEELKNIGVAFTDEAAKLAVISKTDITDAAGNLKAAALGFDIPTGDFSRITDVIAGAKQLGGGDEKQIGQGLANLAVAFNELGFSAEETGAIISKVQAETDESGTLIASRLTRATTILGGSAGKAALNQLNATLPNAEKIDTKASGRDQILALSKVYGDLNAAQKQGLVNSLGGTAAARELIILLQNAGHLVDEADKGFTGKGEEEYKKRLADIAAQLKAIKGEIIAITTNVANSGILDPFVLLIKYGLHPALTLTRRVLETFNLIPRSIRTIVGSLLAAYAVMKAIRALSGGVGAFGPTGRFSGVGDSFRRTGQGFRNFGQGVRDDFTQANRGFLGRYSQYDLARGRGLGRLQSGRAALGGDFSALGRGLSAGVKGIASALGPVGITLAVATLASSIYTASKNIDKAVEDAGKLRTLPKNGLDPTDLRGLAVDLRTSAHTLNDASSGIIGSTVNALTGNRSGQSAAEANRYAAALENAAKVEEAATAAALKRGDNSSLASTVDFSTVDNLTTSLKTFDEAGLNATTQFNALVDGLNDVTAGSSGAVSAISQVNKTKLATGAGLAADVAVQDLEQKTQKRVDKGAPKSGVGRFGYEVNQGLTDNTFFGLFPLASEPRQRTGDVKDLKALKGVDKGALDEATRNATTQFLNDPKNNIKGPEGRKQLVKLYSAYYKNILPREDVAHVAGSVADSVQADFEKKYAGITAAQLPAFYKSASSLASGAGEEAGRRNALSSATATTFTSDASASARTKLLDLQEAKAAGDKLYAGFSDKDKAAQKQTYEQGSQQLAEDIKQAQIDVASASISDLKAQQGLVQAGRPTEDQLGRIQDQINNLNTILAVPNISPADKIAAQTELAAAQIAKEQQIQADSLSAARLKIDPRDVVGNANQDVADDQRKLDDLAKKGVTKGQTVDDLKLDKIAKEQAAARAKTDVDIAQRNAPSKPLGDKFAKIPFVGKGIADKLNEFQQSKIGQFFGFDIRTDSTTDQAKNNLDNAKARLKDLKKGTAEYYQQLREVETAKTALAEAEAADAASAARLKIDSRDTVGNAQQDIKDIDAKLKALKKRGITKGSEVDDLEAEKNAKKLELAKDQAAVEIAKRNVGAKTGSGTDTALRALADAKTNLALQLKGTEDYYNALEEVNKAKDALALAQLADRQAARRLTVDPRDAIGQAYVDRAEIQDKLGTLAKQGVTSGSEVDDLKAQDRKALLAKQDAERASIIAARNVNAQPDSSIDAATRQLADDQLLLQGLLPLTAEYNNQLAKINADQIARAKALGEGIKAARRALADPRDAVTNAKLDIQDTDDDLARLAAEGTTTGPEVDKLKRQRAEQVLAGADAKRQVDIAARNVNATPDSRTDTAKRALADAQTEQQGYLVGTKEYYDGLAKINQTKIEVAKSEAADARAAARNAIDPRDEVANAQQDVNDAQGAIDDLNAAGVFSGQEIEGAERTKKEKEIALARSKTARAISLRDVAAPVGSARDAATRTLNNDRDDLKDMEVGSTEYNLQLAKIFRDEVALAGTISDGIRAAARLATDPRDAIGNAQDDIDDTQAEIDKLAVGGVTSDEEPEVAKLKRQKREQILAKQRAVVDRDIAKRNVNAFPDSPVDTATRKLRDDRSILKTLLKGSKEYYDQLAKINQDEKELADAKTAGAALARDLRIDLTDPVAVAKAAAKDAKDKLARDIAAGKPKDVIDADRKDSVNQDANVDAVAFSQRLSDAQTADSLGRISHQAYLKYLNSEHDRLTSRLAGIKIGTELYRQTFEQLQQVDGAIKGATDAISQQFNIGNIRVPTVFEVRKAVKLKTAGAVAEANSSFNAAGNVSNDYSQKQIILNGVPVEQILALIQDLYGKPARATAKRRIS